MAVIWAGFQVLSRFSTTTGIAAPDIIALRLGISGIILLPWLIRHGVGLSIGRVLVLVTTGLGFTLFAFAGFTHAPANHSGALMTGTMPLFTVALAAMLIGERLTRARQIGLVLIIGGAVCLGGDALVHATGTWPGDLAYMTASLSWALFTIACRAWQVKPLQSVAIMFVFSMLVYLPIYPILFTPRLADIALPDLIIHGVYQGVLSSIVATFAYTRAVMILGASVTSMVLAIVPALVALAAVLLLDEVPPPLAWAGIVIITLGMLSTVASLRRRG